MSFFVHWKSIFFLPTFKEFGVNSIYKYASTTRLKSKTFALQYLGKKYLNCLQKFLFESLFLSLFIAIFGCGSIFDQRLLFDHKQLCIWPLELSEHHEPGNHSKNQQLKPLRNRLNVRHAKFDGQDFWTWNLGPREQSDRNVTSLLLTLRRSGGLILVFKINVKYHSMWPMRRKVKVFTRNYCSCSRFRKTYVELFTITYSNNYKSKAYINAPFCF